MSQAVILYSATGCPLCAKYKTLLSSKGVRFETETPLPISSGGSIAT